MPGPLGSGAKLDAKGSQPGLRSSHGWMPRDAADERHVAIFEADEALEEGVGSDELPARPGRAIGPPGSPQEGDETYAGADVVPVEGVAGADEGLTPLKLCREVPALLPELVVHAGPPDNVVLGSGMAGNPVARYN
eukprot:12316360-Alexandrium_andersonii.AAC.2